MKELKLEPTYIKTDKRSREKLINLTKINDMLLFFLSEVQTLGSAYIMQCTYQLN